MRESTPDMEKIIEQLENHERRISEMEKIVLQKPAQVVKTLSINEFLSQKGPKGDTKKTLAMGYFLEIHEKISPFNVKDLKNIFIRAREKVPSNLNDQVNKNIRKKHMMEITDKKDKSKAFVLTSSGITFVENNFQVVGG